MVVLVFLLALQLIPVVVGFAVKTLLRLAFIGIIPFVATSIIGINRRRTSGSHKSGI